MGDGTHYFVPPFFGLLHPLTVFLPFGIVNNIDEPCLPVVPGDGGKVENRTPDLTIL